MSIVDGSVSFPEKMRFCQIDRVTLLEPGVKIEALRTLRVGEDYLRDHFPRFEVMPGVLMLEALAQAAALLAFETTGVTPDDSMVYYFVVLEVDSTGSDTSPKGYQTPLCVFQEPGNP